MNAPTPLNLMAEASFQATTTVGTFTTADAIAPLLSALSKAQGKFPTVLHNCTGLAQADAPDGEPVTFTFADLDAYVQASKTELAAAGLAVMCSPVTLGPDRRVLRMYVTHEKGGYLMGELEFPFINDGYMIDVVQATGSAMTLMRRHLYKGLLNLSDREDPNANRRGEGVAQVKVTARKGAEHEGLKNAETIGELSRIFRGLPAADKTKHQDYFSRRQAEIVAATKEPEVHGS